MVGTDTDVRSDAGEPVVAITPRCSRIQGGDGGPIPIGIDATARISPDAMS
jgi:hypothetical protein